MTAEIAPARRVKEPGGILLVALGMSAQEIEAAIGVLYPTSSSLTVLAAQQNAVLQKADEVWIYAPLGLRGFIALIRRISWRHFDTVYQPHASPRWLKYLVWPRPLWRHAINPADAA